MTDKDVLEEAKERLEYYPPDDPEFPVGLVKRLVAEVERLRKAFYVQATVDEFGTYKDMESKIESLTKELEKAKAETEHEIEVSGRNVRLFKDTKEQLEAVKKERDAHWKSLCDLQMAYYDVLKVGRIHEDVMTIKKLEAENAELKAKVGSFERWESYVCAIIEEQGYYKP